MSSWSWLPFVLLILAAAIAALAHSTARKRRESGDCGDYWERILRSTCYILGIPLLLSVIAESVSDAYWFSGWHLHFDRVLGSSWAFPLALALPFVVWVALLLLNLRPKAKSGDPRNWLAGCVGFSSRKWLIHCVWLLLIPLLWLGRERLGLGAAGYPAATWSTTALVVISLFGLAFSEGQLRSKTAEALQRPMAHEPQTMSLPDWVEGMNREGFDLERLAQWRASLSDYGGPDAVPRAAANFWERIKLMGADGVAPQVVELFHQVISTSRFEDSSPSKGLLIAPDDCGQLEALALAAHDLLARFNEVTLVIAPSGEVNLAARLRFWLAAACRISRRQIDVLEITPGVNLSLSNALWVVDPATLSDDFMARLARPELAERIGLIVWWNAHSYTGVVAANMWAIARRLHRVLQEHRGVDLATLATMRYAFYADAELPAFVRRLLPYKFDREVQIGRSFRRNIHVYRLTSQKRFFDDPQRFEQFGLRSRHLPVIAAYASAGLNWPTALETGRNIPEDERQQVLDLPVAGQKLGNALVQDPASAGARILCLESGETLSLVEVIAQGGRAANASLPHHVALSISENPYVNYLVEGFTKDNKLPASRRLIVAEGQAAIVKRHLLLALGELEDTRTGLLHSFRWEEAAVQEILDEIASQNKLARQEVRYLDSRNDLRTEYLYKSMLGVDNQKRPLDTVSDRLIIVRDVDAPVEEGGIRMQVDPDRLVIQAYPSRVFLANGLRYRIRDWHDREKGFVACVREAGHSSTWRIRASSVMGKQRTAQARDRAFGPSGLQVKSFPLSVRYQEYFEGVLRREYDLTTGAVQDKTIDYRDYPSGYCSFDTVALVLQFLPHAEENSLRALALALRYVLPVHLGVEDDALEVVPLIGQMIEEERVDGLAIVDLYPRGIGLVDAIHEDQHLVHNLLQWTTRWLMEVARNQQDHGSNDLRSPLAIATGGEESAAEALSLLRKVVAMQQFQ